MVNGQTSSYHYGVSGQPNRLTSVTGAVSRSYGYDDKGNVTADGERSFERDHRGQVTKVTVASSGLVEDYLYDAAGQRVRREVAAGASAGEVLYSVRGPGGEVLADYDAQGALVREYVYGGGGRIAQHAHNETAYFLTDHLGSVRRLYGGATTDSGGAATRAVDYLPFGEKIAMAGQVVYCSPSELKETSEPMD